MNKLQAYREFLARKVNLDSHACGFEIDPAEVHPLLKPHQRAAVVWAVRGGRRALFERFGLGKTLQGLEIVRLTLKYSGGDRGLIVCPLGVRQEFVRDGAMIDVAPRFIRSTAEADAPGIYLTNYESVRAGKIDPSAFSVVHLDEAAVLRGFGGTQTFRECMRQLAGDDQRTGTNTGGVPYRYVATATPAPNEYVELLAYAAFLGIMDVGEAKTRFFKRNSEKADKLTLHASKAKEFWLWVASWALFLQAPSDICECVCHKESSSSVNGSEGLPSRPGNPVRSETAHGAVDATAGSQSSHAPATCSAASSSAADACAPSTEAKALGRTQSGTPCETAAATRSTRTGPTTEGAASESVSVGSDSNTSSPTWGSHRPEAPSSAGTITVTTNQETVSGPAARSKPETPGDQSSSPTKGALSRSPHGQRSSQSATGDFTAATGSAGRPTECLPTSCDSCRCNDGYELPPIEIRWHEVPVDHTTAGTERDGQGRMFRNAALGVQDAAREKRETLAARVAKLMEIRAEEPDEHRLIWHDLEDERRAIEAAIPDVVTVYGSQDLDAREQAVIDFSDGKIRELAGKPVMLGSGCNFQRHCARAVFLGIGFKFAELIQAVHRIHRFLQPATVRIDLIYAASEREVRRTLEAKWRRHEELVANMTAIIREYGLAEASMAHALRRSIGVPRRELSGPGWRIVNNDCVEETMAMESDSIDLVHSSLPFATQYEYTPSYNDFGHTDDNAHFWAQMDFLTPELYRTLRPGRVAAIHVKDRITPGGINGFGFQTVTPFSDETIAHFTKHGFAFIGRKTIVTDVVRENNQTYRLGWTEQCKDGSRMGAGMPEYLLLFRKPPTDRSNGYADVPVMKDKKLWDADRGEWTRPDGYSRARWQFDAHGFMRSSGNRRLVAGDVVGLAADAVFKLFRAHSGSQVYDFEHDVAIAEALEAAGGLPPTFMLLQPVSWHPDVWTDVARMRTLNMLQERAGREMHLCPLQFDIVDRVIRQFSMPGETVYDPFAGIGTVPERALRLRRIGWGCELGGGYADDAAWYCGTAERDLATPTLFDALAPTVPTVEHRDGPMDEAPL